MSFWAQAGQTTLAVVSQEPAYGGGRLGSHARARLMGSGATARGRTKPRSRPHHQVRDGNPLRFLKSRTAAGGAPGKPTASPRAYKLPGDCLPGRNAADRPLLPRRHVARISFDVPTLGDPVRPHRDLTTTRFDGLGDGYEPFG